MPQQEGCVLDAVAGQDSATLRRWRRGYLSEGEFSP